MIEGERAMRVTDWVRGVLLRRKEDRDQRERDRLLVETVLREDAGRRARRAE